MKRRAVGLPDIPGLLVHAVEAASQGEARDFAKVILSLGSGATDCLIGRNFAEALNSRSHKKTACDHAAGRLRPVDLLARWRPDEMRE